jgi:hypothetical protein
VWDVPMELSCYTSEQPSWTLRAINTGYGDGLRGDSKWVGVRGVSQEKAGVQGESNNIGVKGMGAVGVYGDDSLSWIEMGVGVWGFSQVGVAGRFESPYGTALEVLGQSRFEGIADVNGRLNVRGTGDGPALQVDGPSVLAGHTDIGGIIVVEPPCEIPVWVNGWSWFRGYANFEGGHGPHNNLRVESVEGMDALTVLGKSTFHDRVTVANGGMDVTGPSVIDGVLWIAGTSFTPFDCRGWAHFGDSVAIDGGVSAMAGAWFDGLLNANGGAAVTGTLGVDGPCYFDRIVEIDADSRTPFLCEGWAHFTSGMLVEGGLGVQGTAYVSDQTNLGDVLIITPTSFTPFACTGWARFDDGVAITNGGLGVIGSACVSGNLTVDGDLYVGGSKNAVIDTSAGRKKVYCQESPECWFEDFGQGKIENGRVTITLDPLFLETVTVGERHPLLVFVTPTSPMGAYHVEKTATSFTVVLDDGRRDATFDWRVVAKRRGYEDERLASAGEVKTE